MDWRGNFRPEGVYMEQTTLRLMNMLAPDLLDEMAKRAWVLEHIATLQPIGRRALAVRLCMPEREVRAVVHALREAGHIALDAAGMTLAPKAQQVLEGARDISHSLRGLSALENTLSRLLHIGRVIIVPGDADTDTQVMHEVGRAAALRLRALLQPGQVLAVTGGTTMAQVACALPAAALDVLVLPARGGMGRAVETQADTLAAEFARKLGGHHRLLHLPDRIDAGAWQEIQKMPEVRETLELLHRTDVLLHGIGRADVMMRNRGLSTDATAHIVESGAVAEAFGCYFDAQGAPVYAVSSVGLDLQALSRVRTVMAVAAGGSKAEAILAVMRRRGHTLLVTDEGAATRMLALHHALAGEETAALS